MRTSKQRAHEAWTAELARAAFEELLAEGQHTRSPRARSASSRARSPTAATTSWPTVTRTAARTYVELAYASRPSWPIYEDLLRVGARVRREPTRSARRAVVPVGAGLRRVRGLDFSMQALALFVTWPDGASWTRAAMGVIPILLALVVIVGVALMIGRAIADE